MGHLRHQLAGLRRGFAGYSLSLMALTALTAFAVNDNAGAGPVRAKDPVIEIKSVFLAIGVLFLTLNISTAIHTITTLDGDHRAAVRACRAWDFFMTMGTFHNLFSSSLWLQPERGLSVV